VVVGDVEEGGLQDSPTSHTHATKVPCLYHPVVMMTMC